MKTSKFSDNNNMTSNRPLWNRIAVIGSLLILLFSTIYYFISRETLSKESIRESYSRVETIATVGEMTDGTELLQSFSVTSDYLTGLIVRFANYGNEVKGTIHLDLLSADKEVLAEKTIQACDIRDNADFVFEFPQRLDVRKNRSLFLRVRTEGGEHQSSVTMWAGIEQPDCVLLVNGTRFPNTLHMEPIGFRESAYTLQFWSLSGSLILMLFIFCMYQRRKAEQNQRTAFNEIVHVFDKYWFLLTQLVSGDFKNKYRRSYLGVLWSLLNPLLMMVVMSVVFSVIFRFSSVPNFQVYLILGQVMFSFYSEATQTCVMTIVGSGQLIKKVYLPKYIFPLSKVIFSLINTAISFIAVFMVIVYFRVPITWNVLYLPFILLCYFMFCLGVGFVLSAMMVFIRDTLHLYGVLMTILGYLTPIFYTIESFPADLQSILKLNPLYHFVTAVRTILLYCLPLGITDSIILIALAVLSFTIGVQFFHRNQKRFILYI